MGDASGAGFGSAFWDEKGLHYQAGLHSPDLRLEFSNFREADNLVSRLEELDEGGILDEIPKFSSSPTTSLLKEPFTRVTPHPRS